MRAKTTDINAVIAAPLTTGAITGDGSPCVMNKVHARWLLHNGINIFSGTLSDHPICTDQIITGFAIRVNDSMDGALTLLDDELQVRLMLAHRVSDSDARERVYGHMLDILLETASDDDKSDFRNSARMGGNNMALSEYVAMRMDFIPESIERLLDLYDKARAEEGVIHEEPGE